MGKGGEGGGRGVLRVGRLGVSRGGATICVCVCVGGGGELVEGCPGGGGVVRGWG